MKACHVPKRALLKANRANGLQEIDQFLNSFCLSPLTEGSKGSFAFMNGLASLREVMPAIPSHHSGKSLLLSGGTSTFKDKIWGVR